MFHTACTLQLLEARSCVLKQLSFTNCHRQFLILSIFVYLHVLHLSDHFFALDGNTLDQQPVCSDFFQEESGTPTLLDFIMIMIQG